MELSEAILARKSIRAFKSDPIPKRVVEGILERAIRAPSWSNTQPWEFFAVGGEELARLKESLLTVALEPPRPDIPFVTEFPEPYGTRRRRLGQTVREKGAIDRNDKNERRRWQGQMAAFFGAPQVVLIAIDRAFYQMKNSANVWALFGCGSVAMNIALLAVAHNLGTCIEVAPVAYPDVIRKSLKVEDSKLMVVAISMGYPEWDNPVNQFRSEREPLDRIVNWYGIE